MIKTTRLNGWIWIHEKEIIELRLSFNINGKYLFFSGDRDKLIELGKNLIKKFKLDLAKVPDDEWKVGSQWVLCVYDVSNRLNEKMKEYQSKEIFYRGWKSDEDTRNNVYSKKFKTDLKKQDMELAY